MNWFKRAFTLLVVLMSLMIAVSCTTERDAVDKTDDLALDKRLFDGEFFLRQTIVDLPYTADYAFIGESNDGKVVKWKITKDWLIAYSIWDKLNTLDTNEELSSNETPIVAYRIAAHYDIVPTENPTTGEALPVLVPNQDRPWNERRYFSLAGHPNSGVSNYELKYLSLTQEWGAPFFRAGLTTATDWEFYAHDGTYVAPKKYREYTALQKDEERKAKEIEWFQFWATEYFQPINDWSSIYTWEDIEEFIGNEPARVTYRYVFTKVNRDVVGKRVYNLANQKFEWQKGSKDNGFRPLQFDDELFRQFGYFTNTFRGYDNYEGYRDKNIHILANYWNTAWADKDKNWNFTCEKFKSVNDCFANIKYQQKLVFVSSPKTPLRMIPINCAIAKDYNHAILAARYAAMNPGSDTRMFEKWYAENYENDFFVTVNGQKIRDKYWYITDVKDLPSDWEEKCFVSDKHAWIQRWDGSFIDELEDDTIDEDVRAVMDQYTNDMVVLVRNPVEGYVEERDGKALYGFGGYHNYDSNSRANAIKVCIAEEEAKAAKPGALNYYETCVPSSDQMTELYVDDSGRAEWRGDRWDCKVYEENEKCPEGFVEAKAACILTEERRCEATDSGPVFRHKYMNGNAKAAMLNWVDKPTEYGILGVAQWNVNPETGQSMGAGANTAGAVLAWVTTRAVELARMAIDKDDPAAWDFADLLNPDYARFESVKWNNNPAQTKSLTGSSANSMSMVNKPMPKLDPSRPLEMQEGALADYLEMFQEKSRFYDRFDFSSIKDSKWEGRMVPGSVKKALFPWADPSLSPSYSDAEKQIMEPWFGGPDMMNAQLIRFTEARARDFDFDESFLDGTIINFIKRKMSEVQDEIDDWDGKKKEEYKNSLIYAIYHELEKLLYKGVAQHEMGHVVGLRHNFAASADKNNYGDGYFRTENYPALQEKIETHVRSRMNDEDYNPATIGEEVFRLKKQHETDISYYAYASVMDYQREPYTHAMGLGKYDNAALKFVYGRTIEQYKVANNDQFGPIVRVGDSNDPHDDLINPVRDPRPEYADFVKINTPYMDAKGRLVKVDVPREVVEYYNNVGNKVMMMVPRIDQTLLGNLKINDADLTYKLKHDCDGSDPDQYYCEGDTTYLVNDGSQYKYIVVSDEKSREEPIGVVFDAGYTGADMIRHLTDMDQMFYFLRYFRRGNPKFREFRGRTAWHMILGSLLRQYVYVHFLLDYNFYAYGKWFSDIPLWGSPDGCGMRTIPMGLNAGESITVPNHLCQEHSHVVSGREYWLDDFGNLRTVTPFELADHALAGMKGIQYLLFDSLYRPDKHEYMKQSVKPYNYYDLDPNDAGDAATIADHAGDEERTVKLHPAQNFYYQSTSNYIDGIRDEAAVFGIDPEGFIDIPASIGRYHRDRYDIQDNPGVYYDKVVRRGYGLEKMVTLFTISNSGWLDGKYRRESRANSLDQLFDGLENVVFNVLSDIATEESVLTFSPFCVDTTTNQIVRVEYPFNLLTNFGAMPSFAPSESPTPIVYDPSNNLCAMADTDPSRFAPIHAGWIYFDKMWPNYWAMGNVANISADTSVLRRWTSHFIPVHERPLFAPVDVNEEEFLNKDENGFYRARIPVSGMDNADSFGYRAWSECRQEILKNDINDDFSACITEVVWPLWHGLAGQQRFDTPAEFKKYLQEKYARYSPAYRIVSDAKQLKDREVFDASSASREPFSRLGIMETTLDQLNSFAQDHFGSAAFYVQRY